MFFKHSTVQFGKQFRTDETEKLLYYTPESGSTRLPRGIYVVTSLMKGIYCSTTSPQLYKKSYSFEQRIFSPQHKTKSLCLSVCLSCLLLCLKIRNSTGFVFKDFVGLCISAIKVRTIWADIASISTAFLFVSKRVS
ncbi:hypothetical protein Pfo_023170 [Paulownia fortunei]|nr:hypothetical protein Pfo_023170 [Paulownia fortunei]